MKIEPISNDNLKELVRLVLELWPDCLYEEEEEVYRNMIGSEKESCYLVQAGKEYIAFMHIALRQDYVEGAATLPVAYLEGIYVKPAYQHRGVAKQLVAAAEDWALQKGCKQLASDAEADNKASILFHQHLGFEETARIVCFIKNL